MSYLIKYEDIKLLISFSSENSNDFIILATNFKKFYVQKHITSDFIQKQFNDSDTRIKLPLSKITKIIQEEEPTKDSQIYIQENILKLTLKYPIKLGRLNDSFKIDFELEECTSVDEIGKLFMPGLLKTIIEQKLQNKDKEQLSISFPQTLFEANFAVNSDNIGDFGEMIGVQIDFKNVTDSKSDELTRKSGESSSFKGNKRIGPRNPIKVNQEFKFEKLEDSQEVEVPAVVKNKQPAASTTMNKKVKKRPNIKF